MDRHYGLKYPAGICDRTLVESAGSYSSLRRLIRFVNLHIALFIRYAQSLTNGTSKHRSKAAAFTRDAAMPFSVGSRHQLRATPVAFLQRFGRRAPPYLLANIRKNNIIADKLQTNHDKIYLDSSTKNTTNMKQETKMDISTTRNSKRPHIKAPYTRGHY